MNYELFKEMIVKKDNTTKQFFFMQVFFVIHLLLILYFSKDFLNSDINFTYFLNLAQTDFSWVTPAYILGNENDFIRSLGDAYRLPAYVIFQGFFFKFFENPVFSIKIVQIILSSLLIPISFSISRHLSRSDNISLLVSVIVALWLPLHVYSLNLTGETFSIFLNAIFLLLMVKYFRNREDRYLYFIGLVLGLMTLTKSNNILILISLFIVLLYLHKNLKKSLISTIKTLFTVLLVIAPWSYFISTHNNTIILTSVLGPQALVRYNGLRDQPKDTILGKTIEKYNLHNKVDSEKFNSVYKIRPNRCKVIVTQSLLNNKKDYRKTYLRGVECYDWTDYSELINSSRKGVMEVYYKQWSERTLGSAMYGVAKIVHAFGASFRGLKDYMSLFLFAVSFISAFLLWKKNLYRDFVMLYWASLATFSINAFLLMGFVRYRVVFFDLIAVITIGLMLFVVLFKTKGK
jgi:4-amino-4-deoxy-L-arabinose transferase-like glycosyltransferase